MISLIKKIFKVLPNIGFLTFASLVICIVSGIILAFDFDVNSAYLSISEKLFRNPVSTFLRAVHYWSAQFTIVLSFFHIIDHLLKKSEFDVKKIVWLRLVLIIPLIFYIMFSGFLLRGDIDSLQARNIANTILLSIPLIGDFIKTLFLGNDNNLNVIYIHHISTVTIIIYLVTIEHANKIFPGSRYLIFTVIPIILLSIFVVPSITLPESQIIKGPWYFVGVQEFLHWIGYPIVFIAISTIIWICFYLLKSKSVTFNSKLKISLSILVFIYLILTIIGFFFRGENWEFELNNPLKKDFVDKRIYDSEISVWSQNSFMINNRIEACVYCHATKGFSKSHDLSIVGCSGCHLGNPLTSNKELSHSNMIKIPGNIATAKQTCGRAGCHTDQVHRIHKSLMNTMSGVIAVDKWVFDENDDLDAKYDIQKIGHSPAEKHLRNLCASCHLAKEKTEFGPIDELSRGGGCNACHLKYDSLSLKELKEYKKSGSIIADLVFHHPQLTINNGNEICFGCHSRSGRISLSYEGWHETKLESAPDSSYRVLQDGRILSKQLSDIHHEKGMLCIDCHLSYEIMGDGNNYSHKEEQVKIQCIDCHSADNKFVGYKSIDYETQRIIDLRELYNEDRKFLKSKSGLIYSNIYSRDDSVIVYLKKFNTELSPKRIISECGMNIPGHETLACETCHSSWSPHCIGCHTEYIPNETGWDNLKDTEVKGAWTEADGLYLAETPVMGVDDSNGKSVKNFIPGMVMTIKNGKDKIFKRLYSPAFSHTIRPESRSCKSCHFNSQAIGYGKGELLIKKNDKSIEFRPYYQLNENDLLPEDAWLGFMEERTMNSSTRKNHRPFNIVEQKDILRVGACFNCHKENEKFIQIFSNNDKWKDRITEQCILLY